MSKSILIFVIIQVCFLTSFGQVFENSDYPKYSPSLLKQDLDFIFKKFEQVHPDFYKETTKDTVLKHLEILKAKIIKPMTRMDFKNLFAPVLFNVVTDGHNYVNSVDEELKQYKKEGGLFFPLPVNIRNKRIYCNSLKAEIPFNTEIISINKVSAKDVVNKVLGGYKAESESFAEVLNSPWFSGEYWQSYGGFQEYNIRYIENGNLKTAIIKGRTEGQLEKLRITTQGKNYTFYELPDLKTGVIRYNACEDLKNFRPFCDSVFSIMRKKGYGSLIIDIRSNLGGTTRLNEILYEYLTDKPIAQFDRIETKISKEKKQDFIETNRQYAGWFKWYNYLYYPIYIRINKKREEILTAQNGSFVNQYFKPETPKANPLLFHGKMYLLISERTYSAAAIFAAAIKAYKVGLVVGQETGEPTTFTANTVNIIMPNTKLVCSVSCDRFFLAGWKNDRHGVIPDVIIKRNANSIVDEELEYVKNMVKTQ